MKSHWSVPLLILIAITALPACQPRVSDNRLQSQSANPVQTQETNRMQAQAAQNSHHHLNDPSVIPSYDSAKTQSTNEHGGTTHGMGSSVYSLIGSSGLHSDGFSSHLESRLSGAGVDGVKVFVVDDMVILATESRKATASQYDPLQQKVLSNTGGSASRGPEPNSTLGTMGTGNAGDDNLDIAANRIKEFIGGNVKVFTVTGSQAVQTIDRIRSGASDPSVSPRQLSDDISKLLSLAMGNKK